ncbi:MAG TPA: tetratricopeptide repeat protein, partial [Tepidisphaeraceae bacterium]|nr:tetratricopeptide repeat protein [Tepidisphaeraceae bacterium]
AQWQAKLDGHYVKVGDRWLTPAEHAALVAGEADAANRIGLLIESDQYQDASDALTQALAADPQDPAALYLHGVVLADQGQTLAAREEFQKVAKIIPHHVPTLNNLGVLFSKQQAYPIALASYMAAMKLRPDDLLILNNVAEALHAVPTEQQQSPVVVDATKMFQEQDKRLQQEQAEKGLYRWGATWVSKQQLDDLQAQQQQIEGQMALLQSDYQNTISQINSDNMAITEDQQNVQAYQQQYSFSTMSPPVRGRGGFGYTNSSFGINNSYTGQNYASNQADLNRATADKQTQMQHLADLRTRAAQLQQTLSVPPFSGLQHLIGPEGTPIQTAPATQPAAP